MTGTTIFLTVIGLIFTALGCLIVYISESDKFLVIGAIMLLIGVCLIVTVGINLM